MPKQKGQHRENRLTAAEVKALRHPGRYMDGRGLFLKVDASGAKRWGQRIMVLGRRVDLGLGGYPDVSLSEARELATENRRVAKAGGDPLAAKVAAQAIPTFGEAVEAYLAAKLDEFRSEKHRKQWQSTLDTYAKPVLGKKPVSEVRVQDLLRVLEPIWQSKTETASRLRGRIENVLSWATVAGHRKGDNPARWKGNLEALLPKPGKVAKTDNQPALALGDAPRWWSELRDREGMAARALEFLTLCASRSGEVRGMTWDEVDLAAGNWIIPADRMKARREHRVPLTHEAAELLRSLPRMEGSPYVFFATRGGMLSDMSISAVMRRMQEAEVKAGCEGFLDPRNKRPAVPHGLRSTFRQWAAERGYPRDMAELALAHFVGSEVERAYQRSDMLERRRHMLAAWSAFLTGQTHGEVVELNSARA